MITEKIVWGNNIHPDGTVKKEYVYECETSEEFIVLMHKLTNEKKANLTGEIKQKRIKFFEWVAWLNMDSPHIKRGVEEMTEKTELIFDDGITDEMWDEVNRIMEEEE
jgi:hypothetical protein